MDEVSGRIWVVVQGQPPLLRHDGRTKPLEPPDWWRKAGR
jgi:hypothetical protein